MKLYRLTFILTLVILFPQACKTSKVIKEDSKNIPTELIVFQNGLETRINSEAETVEIDKKGFSLRFYNKRYNPDNKEFYSAQIAAFISESELDKVEIGMPKSELPCFEPGSGMAPASSGKYETLIFNSSGHHYTTYTNSESKRLNLLDDSGEFLKLEFEISSLYYDKMEYEMPETNLREFYIAFLIDRNLNGTIEKGELTKLTIKMK